MIETTWADLVDLRDSEELIPGCFYRITDYNFITSKVNIHSGNHQFDIIVLAISESMLSETAYAARHSGDNYFEREVSTGGIEWLYTVYVDDYATNYGEDIVDHADDIHAGDVFCDSGTMEHPTSGDIVPVLYKTDSSEYDFDDPDYSDVFFYEGTYDFDGDDYDMWSKWEQVEGDLVFKSQYALTPVVVDNDELTVSPVPVEKAVSVNMNAWELKYCLDNDKTLFDWADTNGKGVIYYMKDEFGNEAPYDFKNAMFERRKITAVTNSTILNSLLNKYLGESTYYNITCNANDKQYLYTFGIYGNNNDVGITDGSLFGDNSYNTIKPYIYEGMRLINNIVCSGSNNTFGNDCYDMTIVGSNNIFQINCMTNLLVAASQNYFDGRIHHTTIIQSSSCSFGKYSNSIMGTNITDSVIGDSCNNLNLGTACAALRLGRGCSNNSFGNYCYNLTLGENVTASQFGGNYCSYNTIGSFSSNIRITTNSIRYSTIEQNCKNITINTSNSTTYIQYVKICAGVSNLTIQPARGLTYEQIWYKAGRIENAV